MLTWGVERNEMRVNTIGAIILGVVMVTAIPAASMAVPAGVGGAAVDPAAAQGPPSLEGAEVTDLTAPENATQGDVVTVEATIANTGDEAAAGTVKYKFDDSNRGAERIDLGPGDTTTVSFELRTNGIDPGVYEHGVYAGEESETVEIEIEAGDRGEPGPDRSFAVSNLTAPENASQGEWIDVTATITNTGDQRAAGPVKYRIDDSVRRGTGVNLEAGESTTVTFEFNTQPVDPGNYTHGVYAGENNATAEIEILAGDGDGDDSDEENDLTAFQNTTALDENQTEPDNLSGKIRVEEQYADNTSVELVVDTEENSTLEITAPDDAENVTFYLQGQAVEASQDLDNVTLYLDGEEITLHEDAGPGNSPWIAFEVDHFSTRTLAFVSESSDDGGEDDDDNGGEDDGGDDDGDDELPPVGEAPPQDLNGDGLYRDVDGDGEFTVSDIQTLFENLDTDAVQERSEQFNFTGSNSGQVTVGDVQALFFDLSD